MTPKFEIGQIIKHVNNSKADAGPVIGFSFTPQSGFVYTIELQEWEIETRTTHMAVMHIAESEAEEVTNAPASAPQVPVEPEVPAPTEGAAA